MASEDGVSAHRVWKTFALPALREVTFDAPAGEVLAVLGPNGAGKTTLLRVIAGIARPSRGEVRIAAQPWGSPRARRAVGLAGHQSFLTGHLTALENLQFYADLYGLPAGRAHAALEEFDLVGLRHHQVRTLSRGTVQRLSLARAFLHDPPIVLLDEPFTGLDAPSAAALAARLRRLREQGRCVIMATHSLSEVRDLADMVMVLVRGRLVAREPAAAMTAARLLQLYADGVRGPGSGVRQDPAAFSGRTPDTGHRTPGIGQ